jgi:hypothetical protein
LLTLAKELRDYNVTGNVHYQSELALLAGRVHNFNNIPAKLAWVVAEIGKAVVEEFVNFTDAFER